MEWASFLCENGPFHSGLGNILSMLVVQSRNSGKSAQEPIVCSKPSRSSDPLLAITSPENQLARPCSKLVGFGPDQSPVSHLHPTWFPLQD
uniref:(California timema) hypothetical protein n=1 Tax=Timema californicum TaxID=61474 RepID=A0A7R9J2F1_TIMCA|nr:unnamed protein product [Timema californicum]